MRAISIFLALAVGMAALASIPREARALDVPKLTLFVEAGVGDKIIFSPDKIVVPSVPIILNVTVLNNGTTGLHTFSIRDSGGTKQIDVRLQNLGDSGSVEFAVNSSTEIYFKGQRFRAEPLGGGIKFYCEPHETVGMIGTIVVGGVTPPQKPEIGLFLRAYWIGLIGLGAMLVWIGFTYFIIKSSSHHFRDHREHIRRGLT